MHIGASDPRFTAARAFVAVACASGMCTGCTLVGLGVGSSIGRWETVPPAALESPRKDSPVDVEVKRRFLKRPEEPSGPWSVEIVRGTLVARGENEIVVATGEGETTIDVDAIQEVHVRKGSHWVEGLVVGALVDVAVVVAVVSLASQPTFETHSMNLGGF